MLLQDILSMVGVCGKQRQHRRGRKLKRRLILSVERLDERITPDANSSGPLGIDALRTGLNGQGVRIGILEAGRPAMNGDGALIHPDVSPTAAIFAGRGASASGAQGRNYVFGADGSAGVQERGFFDRTFHSLSVAGVMIANNPNIAANRGFALGASLDGASSGYNHSLIGTFYFLDAMQALEVRNAGPIPAINLSASMGVTAQGIQYDGSSLMSQGVDYFMSAYNTLLVIASPNTQRQVEGRVLPQDAYNGLVVAGAIQSQMNGSFDKVNVPPLADGNGRRLIDLIAPGFGILAPIVYWFQRG